MFLTAQIPGNDPGNPEDGGHGKDQAYEKQAPALCHDLVRGTVLPGGDTGGISVVAAVRIIIVIHGYLDGEVPDLVGYLPHELDIDVVVHIYVLGEEGIDALEGRGVSLDGGPSDLQAHCPGPGKRLGGPHVGNSDGHRGGGILLGIIHLHPGDGEVRSQIECLLVVIVDGGGVIVLFRFKDQPVGAEHVVEKGLAVPGFYGFIRMDKDIILPCIDILPGDEYIVVLSCRNSLDLLIADEPLGLCSSHLVV